MVFTYTTSLRGEESLTRARNHVARLFGYRSETSIRQMLDGKQAVPGPMADWLMRLAEWMRNHPPQR